jgi:hypothetical protein
VTLHLLLRTAGLEPEPEISMPSPLPAVELLGGRDLEGVPRHREEHVEQRLHEELGQVLRLESGRVHLVAEGSGELRLGGQGVVRERRREGGVETFRGVQIQTVGREVGAKSQNIEVLWRDEGGEGQERQHSPCRSDGSHRAVPTSRTSPQDEEERFLLPRGSALVRE